ncbi:mCG144696, partial [Mus musculus]
VFTTSNGNLILPRSNMQACNGVLQLTFCCCDRGLTKRLLEKSFPFTSSYRLESIIEENQDLEQRTEYILPRLLIELRDNELSLLLISLR